MFAYKTWYVVSNITCEFAGTSLPEAIIQHASLNYDGSFLLIGGAHYDACNATGRNRRWMHRLLIPLFHCFPPLLTNLEVSWPLSGIIRRMKRGIGGSIP